MTASRQRCEDIGVPIAFEKTEGSSQILMFLGIELDTTAGVARLSHDKLNKGLQLVRGMSSRGKASLRELTGFLYFTTSVIPLLYFTTSVIPPGRPFLRKFINLTKGLKNPYYRTRITHEVKYDLVLWEQFLQGYNGVSFFIDEEWLESSKLHLYTDASSTLGYGLVFGKKWVFGRWPPIWYLCLSLY
jgi:hypothetical protein